MTKAEMIKESNKVVNLFHALKTEYRLRYLKAGLPTQEVEDIIKPVFVEKIYPHTKYLSMECEKIDVESAFNYLDTMGLSHYRRLKIKLQKTLEGHN